MSDVKTTTTSTSRPMTAALAPRALGDGHRLPAARRDPLRRRPRPEDFFTGGNLNSILSDIVEIAIIALPLTLIIVAAEIDLSVASVVGLTSALMGYLWNHGWAMEMIIPTVLVAGALAGALNGVLVTRLGLPSLAVTIGTLGLYRGLAYVILGDTAVADFPSQFTDWGFGTFAGTQIPNPFVLFIGARGGVRHRPALHGHRALDLRDGRQRGGRALLRRPRQAHQVLAVRGHRRGGRAGRHRLHLPLRLGAAPTTRLGLELSVVAVVLLGGVSIFGGRGHLLGRHLRRAAAGHAAQRADAQRRLAPRC